MEKENLARQQAIREVRAAIREDRMFVGYQPIIDLTNGRTVAFEALMRLTAPTGHCVTATEVFPALISPVLSREIRRHMLGLIGEEFHQLQDSHPDLDYVSINASEADLLSSGFTDDFLSALGSRGVDLSKIMLEVTETMLLVEDTEAIQERLYRLRSAGVRIALDDFGTGYSSLTHLRDFPIDKVKIDGSFVQSLPYKNLSRTIVQGLIGMAISMNIDVIAEGVETEEQMHLLGHMGCHYGQGFHFGHAQNAARISLKAIQKHAAESPRRSAA
jgi:EAL domain-containing protein (putative c-di-GMP-specific phosphodiesterase class I)